MSDTSLNDFDSQTREQALKNISEAGEFPEPSTLLNLHAHTFYSFNYKGFSPSTFAVEEKRAGLEAAGIVDFDVLDGLDEFWSATRKLDIKACVGLESRVLFRNFLTG